MVQVTVKEGILEGEVVVNDDDESGKTFFSFKGIPYAEPPLENLRFKAPQPLKPWTGVKLAKNFGSICYQLDVFNQFSPQGSEDCLYLNVYTPDLKPLKPLPVMVWIHGGGYVNGSGDDNLYAPGYLVRHEVILVTINYRLEVLGFLCLDTKDVPGNAGMKDQVAALRWVNKNITSFGGDPENITIFGESAGAASIGYHLVSPMTKGLFRRAILQSGASTCWWSNVSEAKDRALTIARKLGFRSESDEELYDFYKGLPVDSLIGQQLNAPLTFAEREKTIYEAAFVVVDEKKFGDNERFFFGSFNYENLCQNIHDDVEVFLGFNEDEGLLSLCIGNIENKLREMNNFVEEFVPKPIAYSCSVPQRLKVGKKLKEFYFKNNTDIGMGNWEQLVKFSSMDYFVYGIIQMAKMLASLKKNRVYLYQFSCVSERNRFVDVIGIRETVKDKPVVCHGDDIFYLFPGKHFAGPGDKNPEVKRIIKTVSTIWTNIAKYGNPTPDESFGVKWYQYTLEKQEYLDIGNKLEIRTAPHKQEIQFWENLYKEYAPDFVYK